jgi:UDP-N-acetyl-2-amino-2-deoxyglucuronate dehydrogenase
MGRQWRSGVVGVGVIGEWHAKVISTLPQCTLAAVCDTQPDRAKQKLAKLGLENVAVYSDIQSMLSEQQLDVVHICTPSGNHLEPALAAMKAKVNVICEKPMEITVERIDQLIAAAAENGVRLAGIFQNRWHDANRAIQEAVQRGRFGTIAYAGCYTPWYRTDQYYREGGWRGTWKLDGGGAMMNQSIHQVDMLQWIAGPIRQVSAYASSRIHQEIEVEDTLTCAAVFENGAYGTIMGSTAMYPGIPVRVEIGGERGTAVSEGGLRVFTFRDATDADKQLQERVNAQGTTGRNVESILEAWERGEDAVTNGPEARKAVAIIQAMYESAKRGGVPVMVG